MKKYFCFILAVLTFFSCKNSIEIPVEVIPVNLDRAKSIDLNMGKMIKLETAESSLLYDIISISFINKKLFIRTRNKVVVFDSDGKFLFNLSRKGKGPSEYTNISSVFEQNGYICLFDNMNKKILIFNDSGDFISSVNINLKRNPLADIYPLSDGRFVGKNMFQGDKVKTPVGSILNGKYELNNTVVGKNILSGFTTYNNFHQFDNNEVLYYEPLCDTIFSFWDYKKIKPKYFVDFGEYSIPASARKGKDVYDLIDYTNKPENRNNIATMIQYVEENDRYISFKFVFQKKSSFVLYDKEHKTANVYFFEDKNKEYAPQLFTCYHDKQVYLSVMSEKDIEKNPYLVVFGEDVFKFD